MSVSFKNNKKLPVLNIPNDPQDLDGGTPSLGGSSGSKVSQEIKKYHQGKLLLDATCVPSDIA